MVSARNRAFLIVAAMGLSACTSGKKSDAATEIPETPPTTGAAADSAWSTPAPAPAAHSAAADPVSHGTRVHVVKKGDTVFSLARQYYGGDETKWRKIRDANRDRMPDPNKIMVGQEIVIPD